MKRNVRSNNYTDGRYPGINAPDEELWDDDYFDDDEESWSFSSSHQLDEVIPVPLPPRTTARRRVASSEQAVNVESDSRSWRDEERGAKERRQLQVESDVAERTQGLQMPVFTMLVASAIVLTIMAGVGRMHGYRNLSLDLRTRPLLSLVFDGWHSHINPIDALTTDPAEDPLLAQAEETTDDAAAAATEEEPVDLTIPDGINDPVVPATDYGVCYDTLLTPRGVTYETKTSGIFAPDGTYYESQTVDVTYFEDALFIGDSRTDGLRIYGDMAAYTDFWCKDGMNIEVILSDTASFYTPATGINATQLTLSEALTQRAYRKVYVCIGINELGINNTQVFYEQYQQLISYIKGLQPEAIIYIQAIMHVNARYSQTDPTYNNTNIVDKNTAIATLANGRDIIYLDMNDRVTDENGDLIDELTGDGVHLKASAYANWREDLLSHAIVRGPADWQNMTGTDEDGTTTGGGTGKPASDISPETGFVVQ